MLLSCGELRNDMIGEMMRLHKFTYIIHRFIFKQILFKNIDQYKYIIFFEHSFCNDMYQYDINVRF